MTDNALSHLRAAVPVVKEYFETYLTELLQQLKEKFIKTKESSDRKISEEVTLVKLFMTKQYQLSKLENEEAFKQGIARQDEQLKAWCNA